LSFTGRNTILSSNYITTPFWKYHGLLLTTTETEQLWLKLCLYFG